MKVPGLVSIAVSMSRVQASYPRTDVSNTDVLVSHYAHPYLGHDTTYLAIGKRLNTTIQLKLHDISNRLVLDRTQRIRISRTIGNRIALLNQFVRPK